MSDIGHRIRAAVTTAMKAGDRRRVATLRMVTAAIKQVEVDERRTLSDSDILAILGRMVKQRREAIEQYRAAGRDELADGEQAEIDLIETFLPQPLDDAEIDRLVTAAIESTGARTPRDMGRVMATLKPEMQGRADLRDVSSRVKARLQG